MVEAGNSSIVGDVPTSFSYVMKRHTGHVVASADLENIQELGDCTIWHNILIDTRHSLNVYKYV